MQRSDFSSLWQQDTPAKRDFTIVCPDGELKVHSLILLQLPYFSALFSHEWKESQDSKVKIEFGYQAASTVIETLYSNKLSKNNLVTQLTEAIASNRWNDCIAELDSVVKLAQHFCYEGFSQLFDNLIPLFTTEHDKQLISIVFKYCSKRDQMIGFIYKYGNEFMAELTDNAKTFAIIFNQLRASVERKYSGYRNNYTLTEHWSYAAQCSADIIMEKKDNIISILHGEVYNVGQEILIQLLSLPHWHEIMVHVLCKVVGGK